MPEWPEMETYRTLLSGTVGGARIAKAEVFRDKSVNMPPERFAAELEGRVVWFLEHRGKYLVFHLDNGKRLLLHLMLGGWLYFGADASDAPARSAQVAIHFENGTLYFCGLRLGYLHLLTVKETAERLSELGPEPLDGRLDGAAFRKRFAGKRGKLKAALIDQSVIAGIGGCYSDEIAYAAGVRPTATVASIGEETWQRLYNATRTVLRDAAGHGGYMERPLKEGDALTGGYNDLCRVYDRGGEPCDRCGTPIVQTEVASRKAFYCPTCQKED